MQILVLGGTGFIGRHVVEQLVSAGHQVGALHRGRGSVPPGAHSLVLKGDTPNAVEGLLAAEAPEALVHMVGYTEQDADQLIAALPRGLARLILISSGDVYSAYGAFLGQEKAPTSYPPATEESPLRSNLYPYREQATSPADFRFHYDKILVERKFRAQAPVPLTILRLPMVYGPHDPRQRVQSAVQRLRENPQRLELNPAEAAWCCTRGYVEDVAGAIALAATDPRAAGETYNVGEARALSERDWLEAIGRTIGWTGTVVSEPDTKPSLPAQWNVSLVVSTAKIRRELGFAETVGHDEGLRRSVA